MSSFPLRPLEVWRSSAALDIAPITGLFRIEVAPTLMVAQTLEFLKERLVALLRRNQTTEVTRLHGFLVGMEYASPNENALLFPRDFDSAEHLFEFDLTELFSLVRELELHTDINFTVGQISFLADVGTGPDLPLLIAKRQPIVRGVGFEIEERGLAARTLEGSDLVLTDKVRSAHHYYSSGLTLMALEDQFSGLLDAAFMQFYLAVETVLGTHKKVAAVGNGRRSYGEAFTADLGAVVKHVFKARQLFFGHAHLERAHGQTDHNVAFAIAKQTLVARWCSRKLIELELGTNLVHREMRLYPAQGTSVEFRGDARSLERDFSLPN